MSHTPSLNKIMKSFIILTTFQNVQVRIWDPSIRGSELRATLKGHTKYISCILYFMGQATFYMHAYMHKYARKVYF